MKIGTLTFHRALNIGAVLQTYALQKALENLGVETEVIDYRCERIEKNYTPDKFTDFLSVKRIYNILFRNAYQKRNREPYNKFIEEYIRISPNTYYNQQDLRSSNSKYDSFIVGSDQIWNYNITNFDKSYLLKLVDGKKKKNSYAASFGINTIEEKYCEEYSKLLGGFSNISVREESGANIINSLLDKEVQTVLDPVMLLKKNEWESIMRDRVQKRPYILMYLLAESSTLFRFAKQLSKEKYLEVIYINPRLFNKSGITNIKDISPNTFLSLINNADYIVTNSFHGTAFSILLNKNFYLELLPPPAKVNSRLLNIIEIFNLENRIIKPGSQTFDIQIDYEEVNKILDKERNKSLNFLKTIIGKDIE